MFSQIPSLAALEEGTIDPGNSTYYSKQATDNDITSHRGTVSDVGLFERRIRKRPNSHTRYGTSVESGKNLFDIIVPNFKGF